jgi:hypothetical protein
MERPKIPDKYLFMADKIYKRKGLYRSAYALRLALENDKQFKENYNKWLKSKKSPVSGQKRWFLEKWISVKPYILENKIVQCGNRGEMDDFPACRPLKRITKDTPITIKELLRKTSKRSILREIKKKEENPNYRIDWENIE